MGTLSRCLAPQQSRARLCKPRRHHTYALSKAEAGGDLQKAQPECGDLGGLHWAGRRNRVLQLPHQPVGAGMKDEPRLAGGG